MSDPNQVLRLSDITSKIPFTCRLIAGIVFLVWVGDIFGPVVSTLNNNIYTWGPSYQIWRIFTSSFCTSSLFTLFMVAVNCYTFVPKLESKIASINLLLEFLVVGFVIQFLYSVILSLLPESLLDYIGSGNICGIWFSFIFKYCYYNNTNKVKLCCFPFKISKLAYPFVFLAFLCLWQFQIKVDCIIGIVIGFLETKLNGNLFFLRSDICLSFLSKFQCWIPAESVPMGNFCYEGLQQQTQVPKWSNSTKQSNDDYFRNKKGVRLGESS